MPNEPTQIKPRIWLTGVQQLDQLARRFRRKLRDAALKLSQEAGDSAPIGPDIVLQAVPITCRDLLSDLGFGFGDEGDSDGHRKRAA